MDMNPVKSYVTGNGDDPRSLVVIFLRGGADGLNMVAPFGDDGYYRGRPRIGIKQADCVRLDDFFGFNPLLKDLETAYRDGDLAVIHATGSEDDTRSHFEAQDLMEHGGLAAGGWLGRFLRALPEGANGALSAVAMGQSVPESLRGAPASAVMESLEAFGLGSGSPKLVSALSRLYSLEANALGAAGRDTFAAMKRIEELRNQTYVPANDVQYDRDPLGNGLRQIAQLIKARVGMVAATLDFGGWDSHFGQDAIMNPRLHRLGKSLSDFHRDMGGLMRTTSVVVMTEFGRRVYENSAFGTDHGRGGVMFAMSGGVKGGQVISRWPTLNQDLLEGPGDLPVTINYRNVLAPILSKFGVGDRFGSIFPSFELAPVVL